MKQLYYFICILFIFHSCETKDEDEEIERLIFSVDTSLVSSSRWQDNSGFSFSPPKMWEIIPDTLANHIEKNFKTGFSSPENQKPSIAIKTCYYQSEDSSILIISNPSEKNLKSIKEKMEVYRRYYATKDTSIITRTTRFRAGSFIVNQLMIIDDKTVFFKLIFSQENLPNPFQFDFIIPQHSYPKYIRTIESVCGSAQYNHKSNQGK